MWQVYSCRNFITKIYKKLLAVINPVMLGSERLDNDFSLTVTCIDDMDNSGRFNLIIFTHFLENVLWIHICMYMQVYGCYFGSILTPWPSFTKVKTMMLKDFLFALKDLWKRYLQHAIDLFLDVLVFRTGPSPTMAFDNLEPFTT